MTRKASFEVNWPIVIVLGIILLFALLFWLLLEPYDDTEWVPPSTEARLNEYLAAERFIQRNNIHIKSHKNLKLLDHLPKTSDAIILSSSRASLSEQRRQQLDTWVRQGGHLLVSYSEPWLFDDQVLDPLLASWGIKAVYLQEDELDALYGKKTSSKSEKDKKAEDAVQCETPVRLPNTLTWPTEKEPLAIDLRTDFGLVNTKGELLLKNSLEPPYQLIQKAIGDGRVTVLTYMGIWQNDEIGDYDHAYLLRLLLEDHSSVWWLYGLEYPSLWQLLVQHALPILVSLGAFILLFCWYYAKRFGPTKPEASPERRQLLEHLQAVASFFWRNKQSGYLINTLRQQVEQRIRLHHKQYSELSQAKQFQLLATLSGLPVEEVQWTMSQDTLQNEIEFIRVTRNLQHIRNQL
ncbi:DUF4350 domain-containing protein [Zooshikella harenae]|uniref:DUF4350 domain-containing protein n=1 Tax=Zooshikella harenae TaxID=2827238 RepID=A0ABS5ZAI2_9GAMM|nr:DUF4350 domain-containing protein [Zooshikella harenae]MBU2710999.1 DUF4350 domain-containing protein [Zooshikella harenae]